MPFKDPVVRAAYDKRWREKHRERMRRYWHERYAALKSGSVGRYGISMEDYRRMVEKQDGRCAICGRTAIQASLKRKRLAIDHCHKSGKIRGLLCISCNSGLGHFGDDLSLLLKAVAYLEGRSAV